MIYRLKNYCFIHIFVVLYTIPNLISKKILILINDLSQLVSGYRFQENIFNTRYAISSTKWNKKRSNKRSTQDPVLIIILFWRTLKVPTRGKCSLNFVRFLCIVFLSANSKHYKQEVKFFSRTTTWLLIIWFTKAKPVLFC